MVKVTQGHHGRAGWDLDSFLPNLKVCTLSLCCSSLTSWVLSVGNNPDHSPPAHTFILLQPSLAASPSVQNHPSPHSQGLEAISKLPLGMVKVTFTNLSFLKNSIKCARRLSSTCNLFPKISLKRGTWVEWRSAWSPGRDFTLDWHKANPSWQMSSPSQELAGQS